MPKFKVMFICTGNICRSPLAHAVLETMIKEQNFQDSILVDSTGTDAYHNGEPADSRMRKTAARHGIQLTHRSRKLVRKDVQEFDLLLTMDSQNHKNSSALCQNDGERAKVQMFRDYDPEGRGDVPDPWYGGMEDFENTWVIVSRTCESLLNHLKNRIEKDERVSNG